MGLTHDRPVVVAVDGGATKTDVAVVGIDGSVLARHRAPGCSQHELGPEAAVAIIDEAVATALAHAGVPAAAVEHAGCYLTAIDLPDEEELMTRLLSGTTWGVASVHVDNDLFAILRAGTDEPDAVVIVCGTGINGLATRSDGVVARIPALGRCSGDWGGGGEIVEEALWLAARAEDGRGEPTRLRDAVLRWTGADSITEVSIAVHRDTMSPRQWRDRVPEIFALADDGDGVARDLVHRQGREIALLAASLLERLELADREVPLVLGGGLAASGNQILMGGIEEVLRERAPFARPSVLSAAPVEGAIRLALSGHSAAASRQ